jgi:hypothetical protein
MLTEAVNELLTGDLNAGKAMLRDDRLYYRKKGG